ncbi:hypothetical protein HNQ51_002173 [Inhella inkyongensis]|uniref:Uncharacterized protein n=1 Tax=Inhella inkyongensis TaxID=392593 RepID=A0A840S8W7_9BURK|nr:hypothetical protein [Inhella inkyongensis]
MHTGSVPSRRGWESGSLKAWSLLEMGVMLRAVYGANVEALQVNLSAPHKLARSPSCLHIRLAS